MFAISDLRNDGILLACINGFNLDDMHVSIDDVYVLDNINGGDSKQVYSPAAEGGGALVRNKSGGEALKSKQTNK